MTDLKADLEWMRGQSKLWEELSVKLDAVSQGSHSVTVDADGGNNNAGLNTGGFMGGDFPAAYHDFVQAFMSRAGEGSKATKSTGDALVNVAETYASNETDSAHLLGGGN